MRSKYTAQRGQENVEYKSIEMQSEFNDESHLHLDDLRERIFRERQERDEHQNIEYDFDKVDEAVLALLYLTSGANGSAYCAWKGHDWNALNRLHEKGLIEDARNVRKSLALTDEGFAQAKALFFKLFAR